MLCQAGVVTMSDRDVKDGSVSGWWLVLIGVVAAICGFLLILFSRGDIYGLMGGAVSMFLIGPGLAIFGLVAALRHKRIEK